MAALRLIIFFPILLLLVSFALSNTQPVHLSLWPFDLRLDLPLSLVMLAGVAIAFLAGGLTVWLGALGQRRRMREAEQKARILDAQIARTRHATGTPGDAGSR